MEKAIRRADTAILERIATDDKTRGMGTTIVVCWMLNDNAYIAWCGDSRCYVFNPVTGLKQLTRDHSLVQEMVDNGEISEKEAFLHPDSNIITRGLGDFSNEGEPDMVVYGINPNDRRLTIASSMLTNVVTSCCKWHLMPEDTTTSALWSHHALEISRICHRKPLLLKSLSGSLECNHFLTFN